MFSKKFETLSIKALTITDETLNDTPVLINSYHTNKASSLHTNVAALAHANWYIVYSILYIL